MFKMMEIFKYAIFSAMTEPTAAPACPEFAPGDGGTPPYLAGREQEQQTLCDMLERLRRGGGAHRNVIVIGPRGNGKTVLMRWFERECKRNSELDVVWLTPSKFRNNLDDLATEVAPPERWQRLLPDEIKLEFKIVNFEWRLDNRPTRLTRLLTARCQQRPLVLLLDEAHTLDTDVGQILLNASQEVRDRVPFLLVLGGTLGLQHHLNQMDVTFWSRSKKLGIGRLDEESARAALEKPFELYGITFSEPALDEIVHEGQRYPYFLQCWGNALVNVLQDLARPTGPAARQINEIIVEAASPEFEEERIGHYKIFREQIEEAGLQSLAANITRAYGDGDTLEEHLLNAIIKSYLQASACDGKEPPHEMIVANRKILAGFGYVWSPPDSTDIWHAGLPSLMRYVLEVEEKAERLRAETVKEQEPPASPLAPF